MNLVLIGGGNLSLEIFTYIFDIEKLKKEKTLQKVFVVDKISKKRNFFKLVNKNIIFVKSINDIPRNLEIKVNITFGDPDLREKNFKLIKKRKIDLFSIIHPSSYIAGTSRIKKGVIIAPKVVLSPFSFIEDNVLINSGTNVGHNARVGQNSVLSPHSIISGNVKIGKGSFLGSNSCVLPNIKMGNYSKLSAGSILNKNVKDFSLAHGNPARIRKIYEH
jgi:sugar O-acyltransferase (sialic acid O-acetyltransferase NeuD family)